MPNLDKYFLTAMQLVKKAGQLTRAAFEQPVVVVHTKASATDLVTETDRAVETLLITGLKQAFPECKFIGEESVAAGQKYALTKAPTWIIDPIDGTTNFVHRIPFIGICVGLTIEKEPVLGIVYNPITDECYTAIKGRGAFKNGLPIHVSHAQALNKSVICTSLGIHNLVDIGESWLEVALDNHRKSVLAGVRGHRAFGSAAINFCMCAQGSVDAYIEYGIHSWDIAAAVVIYREAGGYICDPTGKPFDLMSRKVLCASTEALAKEISDLFTHVEYEHEGENVDEIEEQSS